MATLENVKRAQKQKQIRYFSESLKRSKVREYEQNLVTVAELSRMYQVSRTTVYKWIYRYSSLYHREERQIVEKKSDTRKIKDLEAKLKEMERMIGQKQIKIDFYEKMIEIAEEDLGIDLKKNTKQQLSSGSGKTGQNTDTSSTKSTEV